MKSASTLPRAPLARLALGAATAALLSGCATPSTPDGDTPTIEFRTIASVGSGLSNYPDVEAGARAAVEAVNEAGGVNGHRIVHSFCNTDGDVNKASACTREAVDDRVVAVVGRADIYTQQTTPILEQAGVPDIGVFASGTESDAVSPVAYPRTSGNFGVYASAPHVFEEAGYTRMAIVAVDVSIAHTQVALTEDAARAAGVDTVEVVLVPAEGVTDYAPYAQSLKESGAEAALVMLGPERSQAFYRAVEALGVDVQLATSAYSVGEAEAEAIGTAADGTWAMSPFASPSDTSVPGIAEYHAELDAAGIADDRVLRRTAGLNAWLSVHAAAQVAATIDGEITSESMVEALERTRDMDVRGLVTWSPADLGASPADPYPRLPASEIHVHGFRDGAMRPVDVGPIPDPLAALRTP